MFSRNGGQNNNVNGTSSGHVTPKHHRLSTSSAAVLTPRGVLPPTVSRTSNTPNSNSKWNRGRNSYYDPGGHALSTFVSNETSVSPATNGEQNGTNGVTNGT